MQERAEAGEMRDVTEGIAMKEYASSARVDSEWQALSHLTLRDLTQRHKEKSVTTVYTQVLNHGPYCVRNPMDELPVG